MQRIVVCDARLLLYNLHHRRTPLTDFKFYIDTLLTGIKYSKIIYAFDVGKSRRRVELYPKYKAHRKEREKKLTTVEQNRLKKFNHFYNKLFEYFLKTGEAIGIQGVEADDIANVICDRFANTNTEILLLSSDADWCFNLIAPNIKLLHVQRNVLITEDNLIAHYDFKDYQEAIDYQIYSGCAKENVSGIINIGKTRFIKANRMEEDTFSVLSDWIEKRKYGSKLPDDVATLRELVDRNTDVLSPFKLEHFTEEEGIEFIKQFNTKVNLTKDELSLLQLEKFDTIIC